MNDRVNCSVCILTAATCRLIIDHISDNGDLSSGLYHLGFNINVSKGHIEGVGEESSEEYIWKADKTT
jgi:hypothetical protein